MNGSLVEIPLDVHADERLERAAATFPDPSVRALLIETLAERYCGVTFKPYIDRIRTHVERIPTDYQHFGLAFLASYDGQSSDAVAHFMRFAERLIKHQKTPPNSDFAWLLLERQKCVYSLLGEAQYEEIEESLGDLFASRWPGSPITLWHKCKCPLADGEEVSDRQRELAEVLRKDPGFWMASWRMTLGYAVEEDWEEAANIQAKLLKRKIVRQDPVLCYEATCTLLMANRNADAREAMTCYLDCLERTSGGNGSPTADAVVLTEIRHSLLEEMFESVKPTFDEMLADQVRSRWGQSAFLLYLLGLEAFARDDTEGALSHFVNAISGDETFWLATWYAAACYANDDNWNAAAVWHLRTLNIAGAQIFADNWFYAAICFGKTKRRDEQIEAYQRCLECNPLHEYGTINLGWALFKAGKYQESEKRLREAMELESERPYAVWCLAKLLKKLSRYQEAIEVLKESKTGKGTVRKSAVKEIAKLEQLLKSKPKSQAGTIAGPKPKQEVTAKPDAELDEDEDDPPGGALKVTPHGPEIVASGTRQQSKSVPLEKTLEILIEGQIQRGDVIFNRRLRMYGGDDVPYGRQFPIPGIGFIDLLAVDMDTGDLVVIELKRDQATREVIGQISEYIGWVKRTLAKPSQRVIPIICLHAADERLKLAAEAVGIEVFLYNLSFTGGGT